MEIEDICRMAAEEGLSYGRYVFAHAAELKGRRPAQKLRNGERSCAFCGRAFVPTGERNRFCRSSCRIAWNARNRHKMREGGVTAVGDEG